MVMNGATLSRAPIITQHVDRNAQRTTARRGSCPGGGANMVNGGRMPSLPIAARRRGAPASDCKPAPRVDMHMPAKTSSFEGQASFDMINLSLRIISRSQLPPAKKTCMQKINVVTSTAAIVPGGIDACGFFKSPLRFEPASGSVTAGKKIARQRLKVYLPR